MNRRLSALDRYTMVSNSDAHSPKNLGREANLFDTALTYDAMFEAIRTQQGFLGTLEFFPEEGKYHMDGHRSCGVCLDPTATQQHQGLCPTCGKPLTIGVLHRVAVLADRQEPQQPGHAAGFAYIVPLPEIISEIKGVGVGSKAVQQQYQRVIGLFGNEFSFLRETPIEEIRKHLGPIYSEAIQRLRNQQITRAQAMMGCMVLSGSSGQESSRNLLGSYTGLKHLQLPPSSVYSRHTPSPRSSPASSAHSGSSLAQCSAACYTNAHPRSFAGQGWPWHRQDPHPDPMDR